MKLREAAEQNLPLSKFIASGSSNSCSTQLPENNNYFEAQSNLSFIPARDLGTLNMGSL